ncbi:MAG: glycerol dehydrogenase [Lentisphaerae bacterium]|nr:glycerol dehydrogenase [Lentisphaerota bacterium]
MMKKAIFPGQYLQGAGALAELPPLMAAFGRRGLVLASPTARNRVLPDADLQWPGDAPRLETFRGECCESELARLADLISRHRIDILAAVGGGKTIDTAKIAADRAGIPVLVMPTIASTDAPCSGCAVLYTETGTFDSVHYQKRSPAAVLVDESVIAAAPVRFLVAGMGDALATWFEARSCAATRSPNACGGLSTLTGLHLARLCYDTLLESGLAAKLACEQHAVTPAFSRIVEANVLLSGIGFESGGLGAAHSIHNGLTALEPTHAFFHGEKVAFGTLAGLQLTGAPAAESDTVFAFCESVGLPTTLADLGLPRVDRTDLMRVAEKACDPVECIHHEAGEITPDQVLHALLAADAIGRHRQK